MGIITLGVVGPVRNKVGPAVNRMHRNINVVSASYRPNLRPPSAKQLEEQAKFTLLNSFLKEIIPLVKQGFKKYAKSKSEVNAAYKFNFPHAFLHVGEQLSLNFPELMYSKGRITTPDEPEARLAENQIDFTWAAQTQYDSCRFTDRASFLVYNADETKALRFVGVADRYERIYSIKIPGHWMGHTLHCYMSFASADGKLLGDSIYLGTAG